MKKILLPLTLLLLSSQALMAQQFSLPILPEKIWPSEYANYDNDVLNCCNWLLNAAPDFTQPKREECTKFLLRWVEGSPEVHIALSDDLTDAKQHDLMIAYIAAWSRYSIQHKDVADDVLLCANVAVEDMLVYYVAYKKNLGTSKTMEKLLRHQADGTLPAYITKCLTK